MKSKVYMIDKEVKVFYVEENVNLSSVNKERINAHWDSLDKEGKILFNGELFVIDEIINTESELQFKMKKSDFAHYIYSSKAEKGLIEKHDEDKVSRNIYTSVHIVTSDGYIIVGEMDESTATPNMICYAGGALDKSCRKSDGTVDLKMNIEKELSEEVGLFNEDGFIDSLKLQGVCPNHNESLFSMVFRAYLNINKEELIRIFNKNNKKQEAEGEKPEFKRIIAIKNNKDAIREFLNKYRNKNTEMVAFLEGICDEKCVYREFDIV